MRTAIYTRVSTDEQVDGYGLGAQMTKCQAMATVKDATVVATFSDEGISGRKSETERAGLASLIELAKSGQIDAVIVSSLDRLGRSTQLVLRLVDVLTDNNVALVSCKESLDTDTPTGKFVLRMFASLAELERDSIVARTTDGRNQRGRVDGEKGGRLPLGYTRVTENGKSVGVAIVDSEAVLVRRIFAERKSGLTLQAIADRLNNEGVTTRRGGKFYPSVIKEILDNECQYNGDCRNESNKHWPKIL